MSSATSAPTSTERRSSWRPSMANSRRSTPTSRLRSISRWASWSGPRASSDTSPRQLADSILSGERDVTLRPKRKFLTTFFSDVRGFTAAAERMEPEELVDDLNDYFAEMTEIVFRHGGTLDKYVGDALMVFFGDPIPQPDHAERAVRMGWRCASACSSCTRHGCEVPRVVQDRDRDLDRAGSRSATSDHPLGATTRCSGTR